MIRTISLRMVHLSLSPPPTHSAQIIGILDILKPPSIAEMKDVYPYQHFRC